MSEDPTKESIPETCADCDGDLAPREVSVTFWIGPVLQLVENVPARICGHCGARHYDAAAEQRLAALIAAGAPDWKARRSVRVPVFDYADIDSIANALAEATGERSTPAAAPGASEGALADPVAQMPSDENLRY